MQYLLDTCSFIWWISEPARLPKNLRTRLASRSVALNVSMVSLWEMLIKVGKGKLKLANEEGETTYEFLQSICSAHQIAILPLEFSVLTHLADLPTVHHDHFDRALVCQALHHNLVLVTPDHFMHQYGVPILWL